MRNPALLLLIVLFISACGGGGGGDESPPPPAAPTPAPPVIPVPVDATITVNWSANPDFEVGQTGGGYRVFYRDSPFTTGNENGVMMVDNIDNNITSQTINVATSGNWYVRLQAFSARNPAGSALSPQMNIVVPAP